MARERYIAIRLKPEEFHRLALISNRLRTAPAHAIPHLINTLFPLICVSPDESTNRGIPIEPVLFEESDPTPADSPSSKKSSGSWQAVKPPYST